MNENSNQNMNFPPTPYFINIKAERLQFSLIGLAFFIMLLITMVWQFALSSMVSELWPGFVTSSYYIWFLSLVPMYVIGAPLAFFTLRLVSSQKYKTESMGFGRWMRFFFMSVTVMYVGNIVGQLLNSFVGLFLESPITNAVENLIGASDPLPTLLFAVILGPTMEEIFFRKLLIDRLGRYGDRIAIFVSALMFGLYHGNLYQFFYAFGLGLIFGYMYSHTHKIRYTIFMHMTINCMGGVIAPYIIKFAGVDLNPNSLSNPEAIEKIIPMLPQLVLVSLYGFAILGFFIAGLVLLIKNLKKIVLRPGVCPLPQGTRGKIIFGNPGMILFFVICGFLFISSALI